MPQNRIAILGLVSSALLLAACVGGPNDRAYIDDARYNEARRAFERTGSTEVVRQALLDAHWPDAMINESIYRIEKEFGLHDTLASPVRPRSEEELRLEEETEAKEEKSSGGSMGSSKAK